MKYHNKFSIFNDSTLSAYCIILYSWYMKKKRLTKKMPYVVLQNSIIRIFKKYSVCEIIKELKILMKNF